MIKHWVYVYMHAIGSMHIYIYMLFQIYERMCVLMLILLLIPIDVYYYLWMHRPLESSFQRWRCCSFITEEMIRVF